MKTANMLGALLVVGFVGGCLGTGTQQPQTTDSRTCAQNFSVAGNIIIGRTFKTKDFVKGVSVATATQRAAKAIARQGLTVNTLDKEAGLISASQGVSGGVGQTVPLTVAIDKASGGVDVDMTFLTRTGEFKPADAVMTEFCDVIEAIRKA